MVSTMTANGASAASIWRASDLRGAREDDRAHAERRDPARAGSGRAHAAHDAERHETDARGQHFREAVTEVARSRDGDRRRHAGSTRSSARRSRISRAVRSRVNRVVISFCPAAASRSRSAASSASSRMQRAADAMSGSAQTKRCVVDEVVAGRDRHQLVIDQQAVRVVHELEITRIGRRDRRTAQRHRLAQSEPQALRAVQRHVSVGRDDEAVRLVAREETVDGDDAGVVAGMRHRRRDTLRMIRAVDGLDHEPDVLSRARKRLPERRDDRLRDSCA